VLLSAVSVDPGNKAEQTMATKRFPSLDALAIVETRDALHAYSRILGAWLKSCRPKRKHWWHASLRPSLNGLTTGVINGGIDFEIALDLRNNQLLIRTATGESHREALAGQPAGELADIVADFLSARGIDDTDGTRAGGGSEQSKRFDAYSTEQAHRIARALADVAAILKQFRAGIREECSPVQLWPHHFDLSMLWLPGETVAGQNPADEESADKQMNFGFTLGDEGITEPYFYVTAYPLPESLPKLPLAVGTTWRCEPFDGAVLLYRSLADMSDPSDYLLNLYTRLLSAGREQMLERTAGKEEIK
jgi:hypothetical protein